MESVVLWVHLIVAPSAEERALTPIMDVFPILRLMNLVRDHDILSYSVYALF